MPVSTPDIIEEINLIKGVVTLHEYGITMLPLKVRLHENKLEFIEQILETSPLYVYSKGILMM
jgi:hypothetical protein